MAAELPWNQAKKSNCLQKEFPVLYQAQESNRPPANREHVRPRHKFRHHITKQYGTFCDGRLLNAMRTICKY